MDIVRELRVAAVRLHVLHHAAEQEVSGAWLTEELARRGHRVSPGMLYPLLHRMERAGLLTSRTELADGRQRRPYRITSDGLAVLAACRGALRELSRALTA